MYGKKFGSFRGKASALVPFTILYFGHYEACSAKESWKIGWLMIIMAFIWVSLNSITFTA